MRHDDCPAHTRGDELVSDDGVVTGFWAPSAVPRLSELDATAEYFHCVMADHRAEMTTLIRIIHERQLQTSDIVARAPRESADLTDNMSTFWISRGVPRTK